MNANVRDGNNQGGGGQGSQSGSGQGKQYGEGFQYMDARQDPDNPDYDPNWQPGPVGAVEDRQNDGRLSENREAGRTKGTTEHSAKAPHVDRSTEESINKDGDGGSQFSGSGSGQSGGGSGSQSGGNNQGGGNNNG
jgi:hypothetical protein